jgi:hypothetical protein
MKIGFAVALTIISAASANSQPNNDRESAGLIGPVHTVAATNLTLNKVNDIWIETSRRTVYFLTYDENGNDSRFGGGPSSPQSIAECVRKYNDKHQEIERDCMDHGRAVKMFFEYDPAGHVIDESLRDENGNLKWRHTFGFDDKGRRTSLGELDSDDKLKRKLTWVFDERGNNTEFTESIRKDGEMVLFQKNVSTFDDKGNVLTATPYGNPEGMTFTHYFGYEFDSHGNWVRKETAMLPLDSAELQTKLVELRVITYYEK